MDGFINTGRGSSPVGYTLREVKQEPYLYFLTKTIYRFELNLFHPLSFVHNGIYYQPNRRFDTDQGSVPRIPQIIIPKDRFLGFYFHDSGYRFKGLHVSLDGGITWKFKTMTRLEVDDLLSDMTQHDPTPAWGITEWVVWCGVRMGGWMSWGAGDERKRRLG